MTSGAVVELEEKRITHVTRSSRSVLGVFRPPDSSDSEVCNPEVAVLVDHDVLRLYISVEDVLVVDVLQAGDHAGYEEPWGVKSKTYWSILQ